MFITGALVLLYSSLVYANNVSVSNVTITGQNTPNKTCKIQFDIAWENSWRNSINYDAIWVFVKYSKDAGATWSHATLKTSGTNPSGFSQGTGTGLDIVVPVDKKGLFLQRSANEAGSVATNNIQIVWDWGSDGLLSGDKVRLRVFAIEMVYISQGAFIVGSGGTGTDEFDMMQIITANASQSGGYPPTYGGGKIIPAPNANWPNGFNAFYAMKYELSQAQYRDFLNTLTTAQQQNRCAAQINGFMGDNSKANPTNRNGVQKLSTGYVCNLNQDTNYNASNDGEWIACNWISWMDLAAYTDWAALRPVTEVEYEKLCRGQSSAVADEYAWGGTDVTSFIQPTDILFAGTENEAVNKSGKGLCNYGQANQTTNGPLRCDFAATLTTTRSEGGSGYYGNKELSGNLWEIYVTIGNDAGRNFTGTHGDGVLESSFGYEGNATNNDWPGYVVGQGVSAGLGSGGRGGGWVVNTAGLRVSNRTYASWPLDVRAKNIGGRLARSVP